MNHSGLSFFSQLTSNPSKSLVSSTFEIHSESSHFSPLSVLSFWSRPSFPGIPAWFHGSLHCTHCYLVKGKLDHNISQSKNQSLYHPLQDHADLPASIFATLISSQFFSFVSSALDTLTSMSFLKYAENSSISGPLHLLFPLPEMFFLTTSAHSLTSFRF